MSKIISTESFILQKKYHETLKELKDVDIKLATCKNSTKAYQVLSQQEQKLKKELIELKKQLKETKKPE